MAADVSLSAHLAKGLPQDVTLRVYHVSTRSTPVSALFSAAPNEAEEKTFCESHLLSIAITPKNDMEEELLAFAIEVLIFTTKSLTTIFVSKADSTGYLYLLNLTNKSPSVVKTVSTAFLQFLVSCRQNGPRIVLSLFARSQNQYLFPGSVENSGKHVLGDRELIKWWCQTLDPVVRNYEDSEMTAMGVPATAAYVIVPGCDPSETKAFFPRTAREDPPDDARWRASYPVSLLVPGSSAAPRCLIPRLPDDPKSRFLTDLDDEVDEKGQWRSVKTLEQFWEMMAYRQECSAGRLVGFIWVMFGLRSRPDRMEGAVMRTEVLPRQIVNGDEPPLLAQKHSQVDGNATSLLSIDAKELHLIPLPGSSGVSSPSAPPENKTGPPGLEENKEESVDQARGTEDKEPTDWPENTRGELVVDSSQYQSLVDHLLELDFASRDVAGQSSKSFLDKAVEMAGKRWGHTIVGLSSPAPSAQAATDPQVGVVNVLTGVRKKRKAISLEEVPQRVIASEPTVTTLAAGLIRKKPKS